MTVPALPTTNEEAWAIAGGWGTARYMTPFEALMWRIEEDPRLRSTMTVVYLLDRAPDWDRLAAAHEWASRLIPRFRERVIDPPLALARPTWVVDDDFDMRAHLRRVQLPEPGSMRQLLDLVAADAMGSFDRSRPPWEASLIEGLADGGAAYVLKLHHSITDGQGGTQLLGLLHSRTRAPSPDKPMREPPAPEHASTAGVLAEQVVGALRAAPASAAGAAAEAAGAAGRIVSRPLTSARDATRFARSLERVLAPPPAPPSPLLARRSRSWRFDWLDVPLERLKAAGKSADGSLNDAYIAALLGGFRRYHEQLGTTIDELAMAMPISLRRGDHPMGGNRFAGARFAAPAGEPDPGERIRLIHEFVMTTREEPALDVFGLAAPALSLLPIPLVARAYAAQTTKLDLQASNVAGLPYRAYIAGARIERMLPFGPLPGCAVMATLLSYAGTCCIGVNSDPAAVTEPDLLMASFEAGLREVLTLAQPRANGRRATPRASPRSAL
ncbi:MAG TPA: wax ester/triacylglycerol synthase family O-acyltransferase [Solirubrobacteraceae bacterium]|nr:wax ester/triacylglycerol synthase family O-acyltransferase [Solirubrobacteraceae bacterium]